MFWACFSGKTKGPCLFWEKEWGTINKESYSERIIPLVHGWIRLNPGLQFMQDNAPGHAAQFTQDEIRERAIPTIFWPPFSPDLNPIETLWNKLKDWLGQKYPDQNCSYDELRRRIQEAWDAIGEQELHQLILTMPQRCQDVIDAQGGHTKW